MSDNNNPTFRTRLLSDAPASKDAFEGGHDRVAKALASLITDEEGGKALAIRGPYGSGKSTVIEILGDKLENEGETRIFTYDAWEHQGDPLRRSFIESVVEFLEDAGWAEEDEWEEEIEKIARRREETELETEPILTEWGRKVALALFFAPLGLAGTAVFLRGLINAVQADEFSWAPTIIFLVLTLATLVVFVFPVIQVWRAPQASQDEEEEGSDDPERGSQDGNGEGDSEEVSDPFYLFVQKTRQETETKTIRTPDPTTIEFQDTFEKILKRTLKKPERQLIFVVDNLDRLPPDEALSTWATMRTFFEGNRANEKWANRFWLIVPFNFEALQSIFENDGSKTKRSIPEEDPDSEKAQIQESDQNKQQETETFSSQLEKRSEEGPVEDLQAFIDKTFTTTFRVAPPVLSDWELFMKDQLREAFPDHGADDEQQFHTIHRLYRIIEAGEEGIPTPRDIKLFINRLSALYRQWSANMSLPVLAAYTLISDRISRDGEELTNAKFLDRRVVTELQNKNWQELFAALHFNVEKERAIQVLIGEPVREALEIGDTEELKERADVTGFANLLDSVVPDIVREGDTSASALAAFALREVQIENSATEWKVWNELLRALKQEEKWYPHSKEEGEGVVAILQNAPTALSNATIKRLLKSFSVADSPDNPVAWTDGVSPVITYLKDTEFENLLRESFRVPGDGQDYIESLNRLQKPDGREALATYFEPRVSPSEVDQALADLIKANNMNAVYAETVRLMTFVGGDETEIEWVWQNTSNALQNRTNPGNGASEEELRGLLRALLITANVHNDQSCRSFLSNNNGKAHVLHHFQEHRNDDDQEITALCVLLALLHNPNVQSGNNSGNANRGQNTLNNTLNNPSNHSKLIQRASQIAEEFRIVREIIEAASTANSFQPLVGLLLQEISKSDTATEHITTPVLREFPGIVVDALKEEQLSSIVQVHVASGDLIERLKDITRDEWIEELDSESKLLNLILIALDLDTDPPFQLPSKFSDALLEHAKHVLSGATSPSGELRNNWYRLPEVLSDEEKAAFFRRLQRLLLDSHDGRTAQLIELYEEALLESNAVGSQDIEHPDTLVNDHLATIPGTDDLSELRWLREVVQTHHEELANKSSDNVWEAFQTRVAENFRDQSGEAGSILQDIAGITGITLEKNEQESEEDQEQDN